MIMEMVITTIIARRTMLMSVVMLKCSKIRLRMANGLELNCSFDILKKASMFSIARGKNYIIAQVL